MKAAVAIAKEPIPLKRGPKPGRCPDFTGVPGSLTDLPSDLFFGHASGRKSPYDPLLQQLSEATDKWRANNRLTPQPGLKFQESRARTSVAVRARKLGFRVSFAEAGSWLYVRLDGKADDEVKGSRRAEILKVLKAAPHSAMALTKKLRDAGDTTIDRGLSEALLGQLVRSGEILCRDATPSSVETYALNPAHRTQ